MNLSSFRPNDMSYQFMKTGTAQRPHFILHHVLLSLCVLCCLLGFAKAHTRDSVTVVKNWEDKNGPNQLTVHVVGLCNPDEPPFDGTPTKIQAHLKNKQTELQVLFDDENYQMEMILFYEKDIEIMDIKKEKAIFIPFFYCGNFDNDIRVSYIIFYKDKSYLFHIDFHCAEGDGCWLSDDLKAKLSSIEDRTLKKVFAKKLKSRYKKYSDFHINIDY